MISKDVIRLKKVLDARGRSQCRLQLSVKMVSHDIIMSVQRMAGLDHITYRDGPNIVICTDSPLEYQALV